MSKELADLKMKGIRNRQKYLNDTDWLAIKALETATAEDQAIKDKRQQARDEISIIRDAVTIEETQNLTINFQ
jgi:hypothetical protein